MQKSHQMALTAAQNSLLGWLPCRCIEKYVNGTIHLKSSCCTIVFIGEKHLKAAAPFEAELNIGSVFELFYLKYNVQEGLGTP
jgi:hypothetical protein